MKQIDKVIASYHNDKSALIQILLQIQKESRRIPLTVIERLSQKLGVSANQIYKIATFYKAFSLKPRGCHTVFTCLGTACYMRRVP